MALASLFISPLMPWSTETGLLLSREVMQGRFEPFSARSLTGRALRFYQLVRSNIAQTPQGIQQALEQSAQLLSDAAEQREAVAAFRLKLGSIWDRTGAGPVSGLDRDLPCSNASHNQANALGGVRRGCERVYGREHALAFRSALDRLGHEWKSMATHGLCIAALP